MWIRAPVTALATALLLSACATAPEGTYYARPADPSTVRASRILHRAAVAADDDPERYGFAFIKSPTAAAYSDEDATFYFTDGLMRHPDPVVEAVVAHEVAHEVMGHVGTRRKASMSLTASFGALGLFAPGAGLLEGLLATHPTLDARLAALEPLEPATKGPATPMARARPRK